MKTNLEQYEKELKSLFISILRKVKKEYPKGKWKYWKSFHEYIKNDTYIWWKFWESEYYFKWGSELVTYISKKEYDDNYEMGKINDVRRQNNDLKESYYTYGKCRESNIHAWNNKMYSILHELEYLVSEIDKKEDK